MKKSPNGSRREPNVSVTLHKDGKQLLEELFSRRIGELMDLGVFRKYWKRVFGNERRMLIKKALRIKPHQRSRRRTR